MYLQMQPIHELLRHTNLGPLETKRQNLRRALDQYLMEFNACRCGPCFNNGEPILQGTSCTCQCSRGRQGPACEKMGLEGKTPALHPAPAWPGSEGPVQRNLWDLSLFSWVLSLITLRVHSQDFYSSRPIFNPSSIFSLLSRFAVQVGW